MRQPRTISALDAYRRLTALASELEDMAGACASVAGETALRSAARILRVLTSGFFLSLTPGENRPPERSSSEGSGRQNP